MLSLSFDDIIAAQSSPRGNGRRGIIRLTGQGAFSLLKDFVAFLPQDSGGVLNKNSNDTSDNISDNILGNLSDSPNEKFFPFDAPPSQPMIQDAFLNLWGWKRRIPARIWFWPMGRGYTGEETVEFQLPSSPPILDALVEKLCRFPKVRLAGPGEFTLRAFLSGRLDLTQAEAVLGVIDAENASSLETALSQLAGNIGGPLRTLREFLLEALAHLEAGFDFAEEDIEFISHQELTDRVEEARQMLEERIRQMEDRTDQTALPRLLLTGVPNSGKSSLFNRLLRDYSSPALDGFNHRNLEAIVSNEAGTTRDYLEGKIQVGEMQFLLVDTAGVETVEDAIPSAQDNLAKDESAANQKAAPDGLLLNQSIQNQTLSASRQTDFTLLCLEADRWVSAPSSLSDWEKAQIQKIADKKTLLILTKADKISSHPCFPSFPSQTVKQTINEKIDFILTSSQTGEGILALLEKIAAFFSDGPNHSEVLPATALRCRDSLRLAADSLRQAAALLAAYADETLVALEIRTALDQLGLVLGTVHTDDILDRIFSRFCIGK